jgi:hypothetical protein
VLSSVRGEPGSGGILTPHGIPANMTDLLGMLFPINFVPRSTEFGGIVPGLLSFGPQLASAITPAM